MPDPILDVFAQLWIINADPPVFVQADSEREAWDIFTAITPGGEGSASVTRVSDCKVCFRSQA